MTSSIIWLNCSSTTSRTFWAPRGTSCRLREATKATAARMIITSHVYVTWSGIPGRRKIGGCSIASTAQPSPRAAASPRTIRSHGKRVNPTSSAIGCAHPVASRRVQAARLAPKRSPEPTSHTLAAALPEPGAALSAAVATVARATSHRKLRIARVPPASTPSAADAPPIHADGAARRAAAAQVSSVTRPLSSLGVIKLPLGTLHRSKEVHESCGDAEPEPDQHEPGCRSQPTVQPVTPDEPDDRRDYQSEADRG